MEPAPSPTESALSSVSDESHNTKDPDYQEDQHQPAPSTATNSDEMHHQASTRDSSKNPSPDLQPKGQQQHHHQPSSREVSLVQTDGQTDAPRGNFPSSPPKFPLASFLLPFG